jgi:DNA (cytosine-5)-methyltransferase 1
MKYFSIFSGIGGFELGIKKSTNNTWECIGYSEIDKYTIQIYQKHFKEHKNYGDATRINTDELPDFDILVGGFPCQAFSIAGKRQGFNDTRGTLFFEISRVLRNKRPRYFLLENVKGLLSHEFGETFHSILRILSELGYNIEWQILNSKNFGVPQNRERIFIFGTRGGSRSKVFPIIESIEPLESSTCLDANYWKGPDKHGQRTLIEITQEQSQGNRIYDPKGISTTITSQAGGLGAKTGLYAIVPNGKKIDLTNRPEGYCQLKETRTEKGKKTRREIRKKEGRDSTLRGKDDKKYIPHNNNLANCLTTGKHNIEKWIIQPDIKIRRLTPKECERLQGFPDNWTFGISDTQRYKCLGNAVTVNVIETIIKKIKS